MFVSGFKPHTIEGNSQVILSRKRNDGKFIAVLTKRVLWIKSVLNINETISEFQLDKGKYTQYGDNLWMTWMGNHHIGLITDNKQVILLSLSENGVFVNSVSIYITDQITSFTYGLDSFIFSTNLHHINCVTATGDPAATMILQYSGKSMIKKIDIKGSFAFVMFDDGSFYSFIIRQTDIFNKIPIELNPISIADIDDFKVSPDGESIAILSKSGNLGILNSFLEPNNVPVCDGCAQFVWNPNSRFLYAVSHNGSIATICRHNTNMIRTCLEFQFGTQIIDLSYDSEFNQLILVTSSEIIEVHLAQTDSKVPSSVFFSREHVIFPNSGHMFGGPPELIKRGFCIHFAASTPNESSIAIAGKKGFALYNVSQSKWVLTADRFSICLSMWFQIDYFVCVVTDQDKSCNKLLLLSIHDLSLQDSQIISDQFTGASFRDNRIIVTSSDMIRIYHIWKGKLKFVLSYRPNETIVKAVFFDLVKTVAVLTDDGKVLIYPGGRMLISDVSMMCSSTEADILFCVVNSKPMAFTFNKWIELPFYGHFSEGICLYKLPSVYKWSTIHIRAVPFLALILREFINETEILIEISQSFMKCKGVLMELVRFLEWCLENDKFLLFKTFIERFSRIKDHVYSISLFEIDPKYRSLLIPELSPYDILQNKLPWMKTHLESVFEDY